MQIAQINNWIRDRLKDDCFPACPWFTLYRCNQILLPLCPESVVYTCSLSFLILLIFYQLTIYQIISIFPDSGDINRITCSIPSPYMNLMPETLILHTKVFPSLLHPDLSLSHHFPLPLQSESQPSSLRFRFFCNLHGYRHSSNAPDCLSGARMSA